MGAAEDAALHAAVVAGDVMAARAALEAGANREQRDEVYDRTALCVAVAEGHLIVAQLLLDRGADVNVTSNLGSTPLHWAAAYSRSDCMRILLQAGARTDAKNISGNTPLHVSANKGCLSCVRLLVKAGAAIDTHNSDGKTPLDYAKDDMVRAVLMGNTPPGGSPAGSLVPCPSVPSELETWLTDLSLSRLGPPLVGRLGVARLDDVALLREGDLEKELPCMRLVERRRFLDAALRLPRGVPRPLRPNGACVALCVGVGDDARPQRAADAADVAAALAALGYSVTALREPTLPTLSAALDTFRDALQPGCVAFFYFSGRALAPTDAFVADGRAYLLPAGADAALAAGARPADAALSWAAVHAAVAGRGCMLHVAVADVVPLAQPALRCAAAGGFAELPPAGTAGALLALSCDPSDAADVAPPLKADSRNRRSAFTAALLRHVGAPGAHVGDVFARIGADVLAATGERQRPWLAHCLAHEHVCLF